MLHGNKAWSLVKPLLVVAERHGLAPADLRRCLAEGEPSPPLGAAGVPIQRVLALWAHVAAATGDAALPLRAAELLCVEDLELAGFSVLTAPSGREAFARALRYAPLVASAGQWRADAEGDTIDVSWLRGGERWLGHRLANESGVAQFVACMRQVYGGAFAPSRVEFRHAAPAEVGAHRAFFRCAVEYGAARDGFSFAPHWLDRPPRAADPALARYFEGQAEERLRALLPSSLSSALGAWLERELARMAPELTGERAARALGVSARTLRRRLELEGTSFRVALDDARRAAGKTLLEHSAVPITEVALRLGFSGSAAFAHAARRWFGQSPRDLRRAARPSFGY